MTFQNLRYIYRCTTRASRENYNGSSLSPIKKNLKIKKTNKKKIEEVFKINESSCFGEFIDGAGTKLIINGC
jgi:hypothetical protein